jgi:hypothetical protein
MLSKITTPRSEMRIPMSLAVHLSGQLSSPAVETAFTENVSLHGARVLSFRRWPAEDRVTIKLLPGHFRAVARVAYCQRLRGEGFAVGLEFLEPQGRWVLNPVAGSENNLHG